MVFTIKWFCIFTYHPVEGAQHQKNKYWWIWHKSAFLLNPQDPKYQQKSKAISSAAPNYFVYFAMRHPVVHTFMGFTVPFMNFFWKVKENRYVIKNNWIMYYHSNILTWSEYLLIFFLNTGFHGFSIPSKNFSTNGNNSCLFIWFIGNLWNPMWWVVR